MLEGSLSWQMIYWHWQNTVQSACDDREDYCEQIKGYLKENLDWVKRTMVLHDTDPYWHQVSIIVPQIISDDILVLICYLLKILWADKLT